MDGENKSKQVCCEVRAIKSRSPDSQVESIREKRIEYQRLSEGYETVVARVDNLNILRVEMSQD